MRTLIMKNNPVHSIQASNLSLGWAQVFLRVYDQPGLEVRPIHLMLDLSNSEPLETDEIRKKLDAHLHSNRKFKSETVASTIFPTSMWNAMRPRKDLFDRYLSALPQLKKCSQNHNGIYFERMIKYGPNDHNQLDFILKSRLESGSRRRSILQLAILEPEHDITNQRVRGFPCLQQVSFAPKLGTNELAVNGFYGSQYIYDKAYGNYIGLLNLGRFVAHELGLNLTQLNCFTGIASLGNVTKTKVGDLASDIRKLVPQSILG